MPIPENVCTVQHVFGLNGTSEVLVNTFHVQLVDTSTAGFNLGGNWAGLTQQLADTWMSKLASHWPPGSGNNLGSRIWSGATLTHVKAYHLDTTGHTLDEGISTPGTTLAGAAGDTPLPPEVAVMVRLTAIAAGHFVQHARRHKGRIYTGPYTATVLGTNGHLHDGYRDEIAAAWGSFMNDIQGMHLGTGGTVYPKTGVLSRKDGAFYQLESVSVPDLFAVQRRRQNKLVNNVSALQTINHN